MPLSFSELRSQLRSVFKVVGGGPANVTRSTSVISLLDKFLDKMQSPEPVGPNDRPDLLKQVRCWDDTHPQYYEGASVVAELPQSGMCLETVVQVLFGPDGIDQRYRVSKDPNGPLRVYLDGFFRGSQDIPARLVLIGSDDDASAGVDTYDPAEEQVNDGAIRLHALDGVVRHFAADGQLEAENFPGRVIPAPTGTPADNGVWVERPTNAPPQALYQRLSWPAARALTAEEGWFPGRQYLIQSSDAGNILVTGGFDGISFFDAHLETIPPAVPGSPLPATYTPGTYNLATDTFTADTGGGGAPAWQSGEQQEGALSFSSGRVWRAVRYMANSQVAPENNTTANYTEVGGVLAGSVGRAELSEAVNNELDGLATDVQSSQVDISALTGRTTALEDSLAANEPDGRGLTITFEVAANQTRGTYTTFGNQDGGVFSSFSSTNCSSVLLRQDPVAGTTVFQSSGTRGPIATPVEANNSALQVEVVKLVAGQPATVTLYRDQPAAPAFFAASQAGVMFNASKLNALNQSQHAYMAFNAPATLTAGYVIRSLLVEGNRQLLNLNTFPLNLGSFTVTRDLSLRDGEIVLFGQSGATWHGGKYTNVSIGGPGGNQSLSLYGTRLECASGFVLLRDGITLNWYGTADYPNPVLPNGADVSGGTVNIVPYAGGGGGGGGGADLSNYYDKQQSDARYALKGTGGGGAAPPAGYTGLAAPKTYLCWASVSSYGNGFPDGTWLTSGGAWYNDEHRTSVHTSEFYGTRSTPNQLGMVGDTGAMTARTKGEIFARGFQLFWANTGDSPSFTLNVRRASDNAVIKSLVVPPSATPHHAGGADMITAPTSIVLDAPAVCYLEIAKNAGGILPVSKAVAF